MKNILIISGLDPSAGAGFITDLQVASRIGLRPVGVITNNTVQNAEHFYKNYHNSPEVVKDQISAIVEEHTIDAVKIGMIGQFRMVDALVDTLIKYGLPNIVLDPLIRSSTDFELTTPKAYKTMKERLFPKIFAITPNISEAEKISGKIIVTPKDMQKTAEYISKEFDIPAVIIKGGHLDGDPVDVLYYLGHFVQLRSRRLPGDFHGTGCVFSTAMASFLAEGLPPDRAFKMAHKFQQTMMRKRIDNHWNFFITPNHKPM
ncbi:MAG: hydroxymethylpyrimidine/phosphomethylpyrimidine kinase [Candidatus Zixiibacteriota bacterium]